MTTRDKVRSIVERFHGQAIKQRMLEELCEVLSSELGFTVQTAAKDGDKMPVLVGVAAPPEVIADVEAAMNEAAVNKAAQIPGTRVMVRCVNMRTFETLLLAA